MRFSGKTRWGIVLGAVFFLSACAQNGSGDVSGKEEAVPDEPKTMDEMREEALANIDIEACDAAGGVVRPEGMMGLPMCVIPYADAGAICSDASDCEGTCRGSDDVTDYKAAPGEMKGVCQANSSPFGCYAEIKNGSADGMLCVD